MTKAEAHEELMAACAAFRTETDGAVQERINESMAVVIEIAKEDV